ncbi:MAG: tetratricopeptide repeat protein [Synechococcales cyanobacterium RM1_1_8]|nr:tetratricopeptide repeat protein [Synechococcales cyanobacterium RM1_1_8]
MLTQQKPEQSDPEQQVNIALQGLALGNLGNIYSDIGSYDQAQSHYERALAIAEQTHNPDSQAVLWNSLGVLAARQAHPEEAIAAYQRSLQLAQANNNLRSQGSTWLNLGDTLHAKGQFAPAIAQYQKSLAAAQTVQSPRLEAEALGSLGVAQGSRRDFAQAIAYLQQSLAISERMGDRPLTALTLNNLGHAYYGAQQYELAEASLRRALKLLDELRQDLSDLDKVSIFDTQAKTYNLLQQVLSSQGRSAEALVISEWGRARAFADLLSQRLGGEKDAHTTIAPPELNQLQQAARDRQATIVEYTLVPEDNFLHQGKQMGIPSALYIWVIQPDGQVHQRRADLKPLIAQQQPLEVLVRASRCFESALVCRRQLQHQMAQQPGGDRRGFGFKPSQIEQLIQTPINIEPDVEATDVATNRPAAPSPEASPPQNIPRKAYSGLQQLHRLLIEPIADLLPQDPEQPVIFIPQRELFLVPFPALQTPAGEFLIERHTLLTAPSIQTLSLTQQAKAQIARSTASRSLSPNLDKTLAKNPTQNPAKNPTQNPAQNPNPNLAPDDLAMLVVGNPTMPSIQLLPNQPAQPLIPLPGSEAEAIAIAKTLQTQPLLGDQAKESVVLARLPQAKWIHLATHGLLSFGVSRPGARSLQPEVPGRSPSPKTMMSIQP